VVKAFLSKHGLFQTKKSRQPGCLSTLYALDPLLCVLSFRVVCLYQLLEIFILFSNFPFLLIIFPKKRNFRHQFLNILYFLYFSSVIPSKKGIYPCRGVLSTCACTHADRQYAPTYGFRIKCGMTKSKEVINLFVYSPLEQPKRIRGHKEYDQH